MGGAKGDLAVEESVAGMVQVIDSFTMKNTGEFWTWDGRKHSR